MMNDAHKKYAMTSNDKIIDISIITMRAMMNRHNGTDIHICNQNSSSSIYPYKAPYVGEHN
jgi:hypothetical protein